MNDPYVHIQQRDRATDPGVIIINLRQISELDGAPSYPTLKRWKAAGVLDSAKVEGVGQRRDLFDQAKIEQLIRSRNEGRDSSSQKASPQTALSEAAWSPEELRTIVREEVERAMEPLLKQTHETIARLRDLEGLRTKLMLYLDRTEKTYSQARPQENNQGIDGIRTDLQRLVVAVRDLQATR